MSAGRGGEAVAATRSERRLAPLVGGILVGAGFAPVWIASAVLIGVAAIIAPDTLSGISWSAVLPLMTFLAVAALGEMLVVMTGGIDLSIPGVITIVGLLAVGLPDGDNSKLATTILVCLGWSAVIGLTSGILVGVIGLNPLIVTLAIGQIVFGVANWYKDKVANEAAVPPALSSWAEKQLFGVSWIFWTGLAITIGVALALRYTAFGRRFQTVGANPRAAWIAGVRVRSYVVFAYVAAAVLYGAAGILLAGFIRTPTLDLGEPYLLGPIAAVVIGGASLAGGLASVTSTWAAAFALTLLSQMLRVLNLSTALQFVVFGSAIAAGMMIRGERIAAALGGLAQRPGLRGWLGAGELQAALSEERRDPFDDGPASLEGRVADTGPR
jgi:ribose transport system permease protein